MECGVSKAALDPVQTAVVGEGLLCPRGKVGDGLQCLRERQRKEEREG